MGSDTFCSISGARYLDSREEVRDQIFDRCREQILEETAAMAPAVDPIDEGLSDMVKEGMLYSDEDVEASQKFVLICPCAQGRGGHITVLCGFDDPVPSEFTNSNIMEVFHIRPGETPEYGDYRSEEPTDKKHYDVISYGPNLIITYSAHLILKQAAPRVKPYMIYALSRKMEGCAGHIPDVDYAPLDLIAEQYAYWSSICESRGPSGEDTGTVWKDILIQPGKTDEEILHDIWRGRGNMWALVRPDRFPIAETLSAATLPSFPVTKFDSVSKNPNDLERLPADILLAICEFLPIRSIFTILTTCKRLRAQILPHANSVAHRRLIEDEPWFLPTGPFVTKDPNHGREEADWWAAEWEEGGIDSTDTTSKIPWLLYRRECSKSMSMWNRKRIWGIAKQIEALAIKDGLLLE